MPNKRKQAKLATKMLISGKMKSNKDVQETMKFIKQKHLDDKEDINFDVIDSFGKSLPTKIKTPKGKKRKMSKSTEEFDQSTPKKMKSEETSVGKESKSSNSNLLPKKSQKNKYYFIAHPEEMAKKNKILSEKENSKFIIDNEKIQLNEVKKSKNSKLKKKNPEEKTSKLKNGNTVSKKSIKKGKNKIWTIEECSSGSEMSDQEVIDSKATKKAMSLELNDIDKSFKIKKSLEKQKDGSFIEVIRPEFMEDAEDDESDEKESQPEIEEESERQEQLIRKIETSKNGASNNPLLEKLKSSRFRYLNELLYTHPSAYSLEFFEKDQESFKAYHDGFKAQIEKWPINPLDQIIKYIKSKSSNLIVADFGCGEARLAQEVKNKVHSFDFVALNDLVVKCDMKNVPLNSNSIDIAVFCLSLMGTNVIEFLCEAHRVLKKGGVLKISEVVSRIEDRNFFIKNVELVGFKLVSKKDTTDTRGSSPKDKDQPKEYFFFFDFVKTTLDIVKKPDIKLSPCLYKKR